LDSALAYTSAKNEMLIQTRWKPSKQQSFC
jgi:hypothetical protein